MKPFRAVSYSMEKTETASFIHHHVLVKFFVFRQSYSSFASPEKSEIWTYDFCIPERRYVLCPMFSASSFLSIDGATCLVVVAHPSGPKMTFRDTPPHNWTIL